MQREVQQLGAKTLILLSPSFPPPHTPPPPPSPHRRAHRTNISPLVESFPIKVHITVLITPLTTAVHNLTVLMWVAAT